MRKDDNDLYGPKKALQEECERAFPLWPFLWPPATQKCGAAAEYHDQSRSTFCYVPVVSLGAVDY
jgi:hypothetical protein